MNEFFSELGNDKPPAARAVSLLFGGAVLAISATTSAAFFAEYAGSMFDFLSPDLSPYMAAATGVLIFEGASVAWSWLRAHDADTAVQLGTAITGAWFSMFGGLMVTAAYFALNTTLLRERLDAQALTSISLLAGLLVIAGVAVNFLLGHIYRTHSASQETAAAAAQLRAMNSAAAQTIASEATAAKLSKTVATIRHQLPEHAQRQGQYDAAEYLAQAFAQAQQEGASVRPSPLSENGRK